MHIQLTKSTNQGLGEEVAMDMSGLYCETKDILYIYPVLSEPLVLYMNILEFRGKPWEEDHWSRPDKQRYKRDTLHS